MNKPRPTLVLRRVLKTAPPHYSAPFKAVKPWSQVWLQLPTWDETAQVKTRDNSIRPPGKGIDAETKIDRDRVVYVRHKRDVNMEDV